MSRTYSRRHRQPSPPSPVQNLAWWKSPLILGSIIAGIGIIGSTLWIEYTTQRVIHIRADDSSDSAEKYSLERQQHCRASIQQYKPGDIAITTAFADRPITTQNISIFNSLSVLSQCNKAQRPIKNQQPGTSLILLLEDVNRLIKKERDRQNYNPVVVTITLQDTEPVPNQPQPDDQQLQELVHQITAHQGTIMFMVEDPNLSSQLQTVLSNETYAEICSFTDISNCVNKAFEVARKL
jgi:hypothetical protein